MTQEGKAISGEDDTGRRVPRGRSPSYPGIALSTAIQRAQELYEHAQQHPMPLVAITNKWGYKAPTTGPASVTYAALKKYGLLEDEGNGLERIGRLTDLAVEILHPNPNQEDAIRRAALMPPIHREWWDKYGRDLPPEDALRWEYVVKGPFTENGFKEFLRVFRETVGFAKLDAVAPNGISTSLSDDIAQGRSVENGGFLPDDRRKRAEHRRDAPVDESVMSYPIPVAAGVNVVIQGRFPLTETEWEQFLTVLNAMKPALVQLAGDRRDESATAEAPE